MIKIESVERIRKRYHREWLLIGVDQFDPRTQAPLRGRLLVHSPHRDVIYDRMVKTKGLTLAIYSDKTLPHDYAIAFRA